MTSDPHTDADGTEGTPAKRGGPPNDRSRLFDHYGAGVAGPRPRDDRRRVESGIDLLMFVAVVIGLAAFITTILAFAEGQGLAGFLAIVWGLVSILVISIAISALRIFLEMDTRLRCLVPRLPEPPSDHPPGDRS